MRYLATDLGAVTAGSIGASVIVASGSFTAPTASFSGNVKMLTGHYHSYWDAIGEGGRIGADGSGNLLINGSDLLIQPDADHKIGFHGAAATTQQTVAANATAIHAALQALGLFA